MEALVTVLGCLTAVASLAEACIDFWKTYQEKKQKDFQNISMCKKEKDGNSKTSP